ncbi:hypothetical protein [Roseateles sp. LYH14W]|uniref:Uncharacterized protein n=1 Tax=Pelomonas parva TaxID=3299032 RepID=A0ABW7FAI6_9BURK
MAVEALQAGDKDIPPEGVEVCGVRHVPGEELRRWKADPALGQAQAEQVDVQRQRIGEAGLVHIAGRLAAGNEHQQVAARLLMRDREGAAVLAERSRDPLAYQLALTACRLQGEGAPSCGRLNARRWAELDPSDARPWLQVITEEEQRKNAAGVEAALAQALARTRLSRGDYLLEAQAVAAADAVPDAAQLGHALVGAIGMDQTMPGMDMALRACRADALKDSTRAEQCRKLAKWVLANTRDLLEADLAQRLADRLGVPRVQQAHDAATLKAAWDRATTRAMENIADTGCAGMRRAKQFSAERAASGDLAMALALLPARQGAR